MSSDRQPPSTLARWRKTGAAEQPHTALLADRPEALAVLLVDPAHPKIQSLYEAWGYRQVGNRQPFPHSPNFTVMLRGLPGPRTA
ncbi:hypothetical protein [Streptomyces sp. bgisy126]|uniref:hypothetical protein n=1 Tax=unclassified Streptomyces TaxID=2593676 RepID=UPI003EBE4D8B